MAWIAAAILLCTSIPLSPQNVRAWDEEVELLDPLLGMQGDEEPVQEGVEVEDNDAVVSLDATEPPTEEDGAAIDEDIEPDSDREEDLELTTEEVEVTEEPKENILDRQGEVFSIVPCCAGGSSLDLNASKNAVQLYLTKRVQNQRWTLHKVGDYYYIQCALDGAVMEGSSGDVQIKTAAYTGSAAQLWRFEEMDDGTYIIHSSKNDSLAMDVDREATADGTSIMLHNAHKNANQRFRLVPIGTTEPMSDWGSERQDVNTEDPDTWDGTADTSWYTSDKNKSTYEISTAKQLAGLSQLVRCGTFNFLGRTIILTKDIDLCEVEWRRIGNDTNPFRGSFNGNGHAIVGLSITTDDSVDGLFGKIKGGTICNLAVEGTVSGKKNVGGICGILESGHIINVYSEVVVSSASDDNEGGMVGYMSPGAYVEHCTQNACVISGHDEPNRGGIVGYCYGGNVRYCTNLQPIENDWDYTGGIAGRLLNRGLVEYCANYAEVYGGNDTEAAGGIIGEIKEGGRVFGCYNEGYIHSGGDDYIGGIVGRNYKLDREAISCCINVGDVKGDDNVGGIVGDRDCQYCFNAGNVNGDSNVGSVTGSSQESLHWCRGLTGTWNRLNGKSKDDNRGAGWASATDVTNGNLCHNLNRGGNMVTVTDYGVPGMRVFYQNLGSDPYPTFSGAVVNKNGNSFTNGKYEVYVGYNKNYGKVTGGGEYSGGQKVTLTATPTQNGMFDHFEVIKSKLSKKKMFKNGEYEIPDEEITTYKETTITLTDSINCCYTVRAVFRPFDIVPEDMKQKIKLELECTDGSGGWNSDTIPVALTDTSGKVHYRTFAKNSLDDDNEKASTTIDLGAASPVSLTINPHFGGGMHKRDYGIKARIWVNDAATAIESKVATQKTGWYKKSKPMYLSFGGYGKSSVGVYKADGTLDVKGTYITCEDAMKKAVSLGNNAVVRLDSVWLVESMTTIESNKNLTIDLNGYPMIRCISGLSNDGGLFLVKKNATLNILDSTPKRKSSSAFKGGSLQGGRSKNKGGLVHIDTGGTMVMNGGTLYNGGAHKGGAIQNFGTLELNDVLISNCWADRADSDDDGGAIYTKGKATLRDCQIRSCRAYDYAGAIAVYGDTTTLENVTIVGCKVDDNEGGAINILHDARLDFYGGRVEGCQADEDGGAIYQEKGILNLNNVFFLNNQSGDSGGAIYVNSSASTWIVNCDFKMNTCKDDGSAIYCDCNNNYLEDCTITNNASSDRGALYVEGDSSIDVCGKIVIAKNDGSSTFDNLVLDKGGYIYDAGLRPGSEVHLRSTKNGNVDLTNNKSRTVSEYHMKQYFISDCGTLEGRNSVEKDSDLKASAFSAGYRALISGGTFVLLMLICTIVYFYKRRKGEKV
ncbi:MAG: RICIN domain-containing protein [Oscillospiraceae bacterium]|nr:RICIN domain-containing protein [Oscillospiraceae bacterium]